MIPLKRFATMDIYILVSALNMQLRDEYSSVHELCVAQELDEAALLERLKRENFTLDEKTNQFK